MPALPRSRPRGSSSTRFSRRRRMDSLRARWQRSAPLLSLVIPLVIFCAFYILTTFTVPFFSHLRIFPRTPKKSPPKMLHFPPDFMWGTATASYQIEGGADARLPSIWDRFSSIPGKTLNGDTGDIACDHYHRFKEDVQLIKRLGTKYYRFSIAWPRVQTFDNVDRPGLNKEGVAFYNALIDELLANGITPVVTLYHWDLPLAIEDATGGWAGEGDLSQPFARYARDCFRLFGDRVKMWITLNEPWCSAFMGYENGEHAPGDTSRPGRALYRAGHQLLLSHARAVEVYRKEFQEKQGGKIGITLNSNWAQPRNSSTESVQAAQRDMDFELGWFADPVWKGDYPQSMRDRAGDRLPKFAEEEKELLKGSSDFFGLNHYSSQYVAGWLPEGEGEGYRKDQGTLREWDDAWEKTDMGWAIVPWGLRELLKYIMKKYAPKGGIIITENGLAVRERTREEMMKDVGRVAYYRAYMSAVHEAIGEGVDVRGYFLWSLMDNFEWAFGYSKRFGLYWVDYQTLERVPKPAVEWYAKVVNGNAVEDEV